MNRSLCSGCGEQYLDENLQTCSCGGEYCYRCFATHLGDTGHGVCATSKPDGNDMRQVFTRGISQRFFDELQQDSQVMRYGCMIAEQYYTGRVKLVAGERFYRFFIQSTDFSRLLDSHQGDIEAVVSTFIREQIQVIHQLSPSLAVCDPSRPLFLPSWQEWQALEQHTADSLLGAVQDGARHHTAQAWQVSLPFYTDCELLAIKPVNTDSHKPWCYFIRSRREDNVQFFILNGLSAPIHAVNEQNDFALDELTVLAYLDFFCFFIQGEQGSFYLIDRTEKCHIPEILHKQADEDLRADSGVSEYFEDSVIARATDENALEVQTLMYYGDSLFKGWFSILSDGMVKLHKDKVIASHLPYTLDISLQHD